MPSLLDAIASKYGTDDSDIEAPIGIYVPRVGPRKSIPRLLILNDCGVDSAGDESSLEKTCAGVLEIDLAYNRLSKWNEIAKILQYSPSVTFLNLSWNILNAPLAIDDTFRFPLLPRLNSLILIGTKISWESVWFLIRRATSLSEIHLSFNEFDTIDISKQIQTPGTTTDITTTSEEIPESGNLSDSGHGSSSDDDEGISFPHLKKIMFDRNPISDWNEVSKLGLCFPSLRHMGLADCPIASITKEGCQTFENLQSINLSNTFIQDFENISTLNYLPSLTDIRIQGIPALSDFTAHERRQVLIALLPKIVRINGGAPVSFQEREDAERAFIRRFSSTPNPPTPLRYNELRAVHGDLVPLIDVKLKPSSKVKVRVLYEKQVLERQISVYQTTNELKVALEPIFGITSTNMRLFCSSPCVEGIFGREEMRFPSKQLYSYNIQDGDEIHVDLKSIPSTTTTTTTKP